MNVQGIGIDIESVERFRSIPYLKNRAFYQKVFTPAEIKYCRAKTSPAQHFAARFAAKEAVVKALGKRKINLKKIEVVNDKNGKPQIRWQMADGRWQILISLSHTKEYAAAIALWVN